MRKTLVVIVLGALAAAPAYPWGAEGHAAIGLVAEERLTPEAKAQVQRILGNDDLAGIASWMDQVIGASKGFGALAGNREAHEFSERFPHSNLWHYVDLPLGETRYSDNDPFSRPYDVVHELKVGIQVLEGKSTVVSPRIALFMVVHFVGDLHQPLHVACAYYQLTDPEHPVLVTDPRVALAQHLQDDKGANLLQYGADRWEELHAYWDSRLPEKVADSRDVPALAAKIRDSIQPEAWASSGDYHFWPEAWATESLIAARTAYQGIAFGRADMEDGRLLRIHIRLPADYDEVEIPVAQERLAKAAFHLAELLNAIHWGV